MTAEISVISRGRHLSKAALLGQLTAEHSLVLARELDHLTGNVVLECERLDDLDAASATVLLEFRDARDTEGYRVLFRGLPPRRHAQLLEQAGHRPTGRSSSDRSHDTASVLDADKGDIR